MTTKMSLHRAMAEIKNLEQSIQKTFVVAGLASNKDGLIYNTPKDKFISEVQSNLDKYISDCSRLEKLKKARNLANSTTVIQIDGEEMTIDQAIIRKNIILHVSNVVQHMRQSIAAGNNQVALSSVEVDRKVEEQLKLISGSTKKVSDEETKVIRQMFEKSTGKQLVIGNGVESFIASSLKMIDTFLLEIDFVLSEANAKTEIEI